MLTESMVLSLMCGLLNKGLFIVLKEQLTSLPLYWVDLICELTQYIFLNVSIYLFIFL